MKIKMATILGARPQFIKAAVISRVIRRFNSYSSDKKIKEVIIHSGQHYDIKMSKIFFDELKIPRPDYYLDINGKSHGAMTGLMLQKIEESLLKIKPDIVLVYGDTNTTLAGALAAVKMQIPVAHVEAGLRSFNMEMPEEINRILTDRVSNFLYCPTETAVNNLARERIGKEAVGNTFKQRVIESGDVMYDSVLYYSKIAKPSKEIQKIIKGLDGGFYLATIHRAENTDNNLRLKNIFEALDEISKDISVILPLHPRTEKKLSELKLFSSRIKIIKPVGYFDMLTLIINCKGVITDSGGLQKESYFLNKFCIVLRDQTEWVELIKNRVAVLAGAQKERIISEGKKLNKMKIKIKKDLFGDGTAGEKIISSIISNL